jgi:transcriptional regulator with XRE-family HTH domain
MLWHEVERIMRDKKWNQSKLAKESNVGTNTISYLKSGGIKKPSFELACKIADGLGVSLDELRGDKHDPR